MGIRTTIIILIIFVGFIYSEDNPQTVVNKCKAGGQLPIVSIVATGSLCEKSPCIVNPGYSAKMTLNFSSPGYVPTMTPKFLATALGVQINYPVKQKDACVGVTNTVCPLVTNERVSYTYEMKLESYFPTVGVVLEVSLTNDDDAQVITCFSVDLQVQSKPI